MKLCRNILIIDDETRWLRTIAMVLSRHIPEATTHTCENSRQALQLIRDLDIALVLLDLNMPYLDGRQLLRDIREHTPYVRVIVVTGLNETEVAVECMKQGAYDFIAKTSSTEQLLLCVRRAMEIITMERSYQRIKDGFFNRRSQSAFAQVLSTDVKMHDCFSYAATLAESREPVLIAGEAGTGKQLFAAALHQLFCAESPMLPLSLAALDATELEQQLFGDDSGRTPGLLQSCGNGLLLLTHLEMADAKVQGIIARLCQQKRYFPRGSLRDKPLQCRLLLCSQLPLETLEQQGFQQGLIYALRPQYIRLPPLRDRQNDIGLLLQHFTEQACQDQGRDYLAVPQQLAQRLEQYAFPGNVAELKSLVFSAVNLSSATELAQAPFLTVLGSQPQPLPQRLQFPDQLPSISETLQQLIHEALVRTNNNQSAAAKLLGITQSALSRRLSKGGNELE